MRNQRPNKNVFSIVKCGFKTNRDVPKFCPLGNWNFFPVPTGNELIPVEFVFLGTGFTVFL